MRDRIRKILPPTNAEIAELLSREAEDALSDTASLSSRGAQCVSLARRSSRPDCRRPGILTELATLALPGKDDRAVD